MGPRALFRGPMHVMEWRDEEIVTLSGRDARGIPVREAFPEPRWHDVQAAMDEVFVTGRAVTLNRPLGVLVVQPRRDRRGRIFGVGTYFEPAPVPRVVQPLEVPESMPLRPGVESERARR